MMIDIFVFGILKSETIVGICLEKIEKYQQMKLKCFFACGSRLDGKAKVVNACISGMHHLPYSKIACFACLYAFHITAHIHSQSIT